MRARGPTSQALLQRTTGASARRHSTGYCFVPDCERVRVNGGAAGSEKTGVRTSGAYCTPCQR